VNGHVVSAVVGMRMPASGMEVQARFSYSAADPYEVKVTFYAGLERSATWVLARSLLADGLNGPAGEGDVRAWPLRGGQMLAIRLASPDGTAQFEAPAEKVARFLEVTYRLVAPGAEPARTDIDAGIAAILAGGAA
jgi:hypothetical protein